MWDLYRDNVRLLKMNFRALLWFEVLYKLLAAAALYPLILFLLDFAIEQAGLVYLTNSNLGEFLQQPLSIFLIIIIVSVIVIYSLFELVVLTVCYDLSHKGEKTDVVTVFLTGASRLAAVLRPQGVLLFVVVLAAVAFFDLPFASSLISMSAVSDYMSIFWGSHHTYYIFAAGVFVLILYLLSFLLFTVHYMIIENRKFSAALRASRSLVKGESFRNALRFGVWFFMLFLVLAVIYGVIIVAAAFAVRGFWPSDAQGAAFLTAARIITQFMTLVLYAVFTPLAFLMVSTLFYKHKDHRKEPLLSVLNPRPNRTVKRWIDILLVLILVTSIVLNFNVLSRSLQTGVLRNVELVRTPAVTAHRGSSKEAPENTLAAIELAASQMADYAEIDVRSTKDGVVVLMHDDNLRRTTGVDMNIWELTYEQVQSLDAGSWLSPEFAGEKIPTLDEVIKYADGKIMLNIEIKTSENSPELVESVAKIIQDNHFEDSCVISTFNYGVLFRIKALDPEIQTGIIITVAFARYTRLSDVDFYSLNARFLTRDKVEKLHFLGYKVFAWGVDNASTARRMLNIGVDNIITSDPLIAKETVYKASANWFVLQTAKYVLGDTEVEQDNVTNAFLPYW